MDEKKPEPKLHLYRVTYEVVAYALAADHQSAVQHAREALQDAFPDESGHADLVLPSDTRAAGWEQDDCLVYGERKHPNTTIAAAWPKMMGEIGVELPIENPRLNPDCPKCLPELKPGMCPATIYDRASGAMSRCMKKVDGHLDHDDGCLSWEEAPPMASFVTIDRHHLAGRGISHIVQKPVGVRVPTCGDRVMLDGREAEVLVVETGLGPKTPEEELFAMDLNLGLFVKEPR
jgi:hypothetical protein